MKQYRVNKKAFKLSDLRAFCILIPSVFGVRIRQIPQEYNEMPGTDHSVRKLFTGFASAAFIVKKLTVSRVMINAITEASINTFPPIFIR